MLKRTPLNEVYRSYPGAKLVEFAGWEMPLNFEAGIIAEHLAVRRAAGLFDVSHMGELMVEGTGSTAHLDWLVTNDVGAMEIGQALYSPMCYPDGGTVDDLIIYRLDTERYMVVVNAANIDRDLRWIAGEAPSSGAPRPVITNRSDETALLALQGPRALELLSPLASADLAAIRPFRFVESATVCGVTALVSRTGYTGEDGFELYTSSGDAPRLWTALLDSTRAAGVLPCGLGARDTLRLESRLPLYGHELSERISPLEAGLRIFVKLDKRAFCGKEALARQHESGPARVLRGVEMIERGVPRSGFAVFDRDARIGAVTSGGKSPMLDAFIGLALVDSGHAELGREVDVEFGDRRKRARFVKTPFYKNTGGRK